MVKHRMLFAIAACSAALVSAQPAPAIRSGVTLEIAKARSDGAVLRWKVANQLDVAVYVYDFYLWGPAYQVDREGEIVNVDTAPVKELRSCPPNRFPPVLLLAVGPKRSIEGEFEDPALTNLKARTVVFRISVGTDPYSVVEQAKRFANSRCQFSPYDAIVRWGTVLESNRLRID